MKRAVMLGMVVALVGCGQSPRAPQAPMKLAPEVMNMDPWGKTTLPAAKNACRDPSITNVDIAVECLRPGSAIGARLSPADKARLELAVTGARRQHERNRYAIEYCQYQAGEAGRVERGILMPIATEAHVRNRCLEFYQRTGRLPNEGLPP